MQNYESTASVGKIEEPPRTAAQLPEWAIDMAGVRKAQSRPEFFQQVDGSQDGGAIFARQRRHKIEG